MTNTQYKALPAFSVASLFLGGGAGGLLGGLSGILGGGTSTNGGINTGTNTNTNGSTGGALGSAGGTGSILDTLDKVMNLIKCWGSSWNPKKAKSFAQNHISNYDALFGQALTTFDDISISSLNELLFAYRQEYISERTWITTSSPGKCSKESIAAILPVLDKYYQEVITLIKAKYKEAGWKLKTSQRAQIHRNQNHSVTQFSLDGRIADSTLATLTPNVQKLGGGLILPIAILGIIGTWVYKKLTGTKNKKKKWFKN